MLFFLAVLSIFGWLTSTQYIYVLHGFTGDGKSSLVNLMNMGNIVAIEDESYESGTGNVTLYDTSYNGIKLLDTPGLNDVGHGYTNEDIQTLIKATLIDTSNNGITGLILVFDISQIKINVAKIIQSSIEMFGENVLKNIIYVFNKIDKLTEQEKTIKLKFFINKLTSIYSNYNIDTSNINDRIVFLDTKGEVKRYSNILHNAIIKAGTTTTINVLTDNDIRQLIQPYFDAEKEKESNYKTIIDKIAHSEIRARIVKKPKIESYKERCNCKRVCVKRIKLIVGSKCTKRREICDECVRTRTVQIDVSEPYTHKWTQDKIRKEIKYTDEYLWEKAKQQMIDDMRNKVYNKKCEI